MCDNPCDRTKCDCKCLENIKSLEHLCAEDTINCECKLTLRAEAPTENEANKVPAAKTWKIFFARLLCTGVSAVSVQ